MNIIPSSTAHPFEVMLIDEKPIVDGEPEHLTVMATWNSADSYGVIRAFLPPLPQSDRVRAFEATQYKDKTTREDLIAEATRIFNSLYEQMTRQCSIINQGNLNG